MGKFNIISKYPKGQVGNTKYVFKFQIDNKPKIYSIDMVYLDFREDEKEHTWAFMSGKDSEWISPEDRKEFIEEIPKFQKGGSYRKTHPIAYSDIESLRLEISKKQSEIYELNKKIDNLKYEKSKEFISKYRDNIDEDRLKKFEDGLDDLYFSTGYCIKLRDRNGNTDIMLYDTNKHIYIARIKSYRNIQVLERLHDDDIQYIIENDQSLVDWLDEQ